MFLSRSSPYARTTLHLHLLFNGAQVWVVDSADRYRLEDCRAELQALLTEEVCVGTFSMRDACWHLALLYMSSPFEYAGADYIACLYSEACGRVSAYFREQARSARGA